MPEQHQVSASALLTVSRRELSLVDYVGFESMRRLGITVAFAFDEHFVEGEGFRPAS